MISRWIEKQFLKFEHHLLLCDKRVAHVTFCILQHIERLCSFVVIVQWCTILVSKSIYRVTQRQLNMRVRRRLTLGPINKYEGGGGFLGLNVVTSILKQ